MNPELRRAMAQMPGVVLTGGPSPADWTRSAEACARLEELGTSAIWLTDHLLWGQPMPEALTMAAVAAASTTACAVGTGVLQLPLRSAAVTAKAAATIAVLSGGRFVLGVGVGEHEVEYDRVGADFSRRGRTLDESISLARSTWSTGDEGDWFRQRPTPPPIPIWLGGRSAPAIRRAAERGDGWMPVFLTPDNYRDANRRLDQALDRSGRDASAVTRAVTVLVAVTDGHRDRNAALAWCGQLWNLDPAGLAKYLVTGSPAEVARGIESYRAAGADHVSLMLAADDPVEMFASVMEGQR